MTNPAAPSHPAAVPPARRGLAADARADLMGSRRQLIWLLAGLLLAGVLIGVIWGLWAPRDQIRVVDGGYALLNLNEEARVGGDVVLLLMLTAAAVLASVGSWIAGPRRGLVTLVTLAVGLFAAGFVAWGVGVLVSPAPTSAELAKVGTVIFVQQHLHSVATLMVPAAIAALLYLLISLFSGYDDLSRRSERARLAAETSVVAGVPADLPGVDGERAEGNYQSDLAPQQRIDRPQPDQI